MTTTEKAVAILQAFHGADFSQRHCAQVEKLAHVLADHPDARVVRVGDEKTGHRYAKGREGKCRKLGYTTFRFQVWAVWGDA